MHENKHILVFSLLFFFFFLYNVTYGYFTTKKGVTICENKLLEKYFRIKIVKLEYLFLSINWRTGKTAA